jgi:hypothetical protein
MKVFVLEIGGKPIAAFNVASFKDAKGFVATGTVQQRFRELGYDMGRASVRAASRAERALWQEKYAQALADGQVGGANVWLVPLG